LALTGTKLSSKRTGKDTYFWIFNIIETERMLYAFFGAWAFSFLFEGIRQMKYYILTNNPQAAEEFGKTHEVRFADGGLKDVLLKARDQINKGDILLNHPLYGSVKPNETPYRSLLLQQGKSYDGYTPAKPDPESVRLIGNAVSAFEKFTGKKEVTDPRLLEDFMVVDLSLLRSAVESADR
jgi:hypothetical protein